MHSDRVRSHTRLGYARREVNQSIREMTDCARVHVDMTISFELFESFRKPSTATHDTIVSRAETLCWYLRPRGAHEVKTRAKRVKRTRILPTNTRVCGRKQQKPYKFNNITVVRFTTHGFHIIYFYRVVSFFYAIFYNKTRRILFDWFSNGCSRTADYVPIPNSVYAFTDRIRNRSTSDRPAGVQVESRAQQIFPKRMLSPFRPQRVSSD